MPNIETAAELLEKAAAFYRSQARLDPSKEDLLEDAAKLEAAQKELLDNPLDRKNSGDSDAAPCRPIGGVPFSRRANWISEAFETGRPDGDRYSLSHSPYEWRRLKDAEADSVKKAIHETPGFSDRSAFLLGKAELFASNLPFYPKKFDVKFIHAFANVGQENYDAYFARYNADGDDQIQYVRFDFESELIHRLNEKLPLLLAGHEVNYLRFFMLVVRGQTGAFRLLERAALEHVISKIEVFRKSSGAGLVNVVAMPEAPKFLCFDADGCSHYKVSILHDGCIFDATLKLSPGGFVDMPGEMILVKGANGEAIPLKDLRDSNGSYNEL